MTKTKQNIVKKATAKKATPKKASARKTAARDSLGNHVGSQAAQINTVLTKKSKTTQEISKEVGLKLGRVQNHMRYLLNKGLVTKNKDGGFALK